MIDKRPALIARCASSADVASAIAFARAHDCRSRSAAAATTAAASAASTTASSPTSRCCGSVSVDPGARTVRVGGGCTWADVDAATHEHGLAVPCGVISTTGVGGLTLGGGIGHLTRGYGLTIDNLLAAQVVLADGQQVTASADENTELFWALRGGGGNFGVVTEFTFQAHPVSDVVGGPTFWPIEQTDELLAAYREFLPTLPRNATGFFCFHTVPPGPPFPEEIHLRKVCGIVWCIVGSDEEAEQAMAPMLAVAHAADARRRTRAAAGPEQRVRRPLRARRPVVLARRLRRRDPRRGDRAEPGVERQDAELEVGLAHLPDRRRRARRRRDETPWAYRDTRWSQVIIGVDPDPAGAPALRDWTVGYWEALHPYSAGGAYVNFMMDEGQDRVQATYGANYDRLARVKASTTRRTSSGSTRTSGRRHRRAGGRNCGEGLAERLLLGEDACEQVAVLLDPGQDGVRSETFGSSPSGTSSQRSGVETGAPGCGRTE